MYLFVPYLSINAYIVIFFKFTLIFSYIYIVYIRVVNISPKFAPCCLEYDYTYLPDSGHLFAPLCLTRALEFA